MAMLTRSAWSLAKLLGNISPKTSTSTVITARGHCRALLSQQRRGNDGGDRRCSKVYHIVADENGGQRPVVIIGKAQHALRLFVSVIRLILHADAVDRRKRRLACREERRERQQKQQCQVHTRAGGIQKTTLLKSIGSLPAVRPGSKQKYYNKKCAKMQTDAPRQPVRARPEASVSGFQRVRFQVWRLNSTIMGNISSLPRSISNESTTLEKVENRE